MKGRTRRENEEEEKEEDDDDDDDEENKTQISQAKRKRENGIRPCPVLGVCVQREREKKERGNDPLVRGGD